MLRLIIVVLVFFAAATANADELRIAVAANFKTTIEKIASIFEQQTQHKIVITTASSSTLFSQISHGAPFDIFLSADSERPQKLIANNLALPDSLFTYALGQLAFWAPQTYLPQQQTIKSFILSQKGKLAIANPRLAPYGKSAYEFMAKNELLPAATAKLIHGNNVAQTFQFVESGNAESGIVSYSQLIAAGITSHYYLLPLSQYPIIKQQGVILKSSKNIKLAQQLVTFIKQKNSTLIVSSGYLLEPDNVN